MAFISPETSWRVLPLALFAALRAAVAVRIGARRGCYGAIRRRQEPRKKKMDSGEKSVRKPIFCSMSGLFARYDGMRNTTRYVSRQECTTGTHGIGSKGARAMAFVHLHNHTEYS